MSVAPYPEYKDSGVEWIGTIPTHWQLGRLSSLASVLNGFPFDATQFDPNDGVPLVRIRDLNASTSAVFFRGDVVHEAFITSDDVLIGMDGDFNVGRWKGAEPALLNQRMCCLRGPTDFIRFLEYALPKPLKLINDVTYSTTVKHLSAGQVRNIRIAYPPSLPERFTILDFLDQETGKIDALVAEQERLIALLKEKRQAVISQAVTKGLNPNAPMKDSGIEWLGQVPAHWEVKRIKNLSTTISKGTTPTTIGADFVTTGVRFLKAENINDGNVQSFPEFFISGEAHQTLSRSSLQVNDVLVVIAGATTGKSAVLNADLLPANTNQAVSFIRCRDTANAKLIHLWLTTDAVQNLIRLGSVQSAQPNLSMEDLGNLPILTVPQFEKSAILDYLEIKSTEYQTLILEAEKAISLLRERRAALISAAVTGKIDVRALATSQPEAA